MRAYKARVGPLETMSIIPIRSLLRKPPFDRRALARHDVPSPDSKRITGFRGSVCAQLSKISATMRSKLLTPCLSQKGPWDDLRSGIKRTLYRRGSREGARFSQLGFRRLGSSAKTLGRDGGVNKQVETGQNWFCQLEVTPYIRSLGRPLPDLPIQTRPVRIWKPGRCHRCTRWRPEPVLDVGQRAFTDAVYSAFEQAKKDRHRA